MENKVNAYRLLFNAMNKLWYIMGGEDGGQVSSELRVVSEKKANAYFGGQNPSPHRPSEALIFF